MVLKLFVAFCFLLTISASSNERVKGENTEFYVEVLDDETLEQLSALPPLDIFSPTAPSSSALPQAIEEQISSPAAKNIFKNVQRGKQVFADSKKTSDMVGKSTRGTSRKDNHEILKDFLKRVDAAYLLSFQIVDQPEEHGNIPRYIEILTRAERFYKEMPAHLEARKDDASLNQLFGSPLIMATSKAVLVREAIARFQVAPTRIYIKTYILHEDTMQSDQEILKDFERKLDAVCQLSHEIQDHPEEHSNIHGYIEMLSRADKFYKEMPAILDAHRNDSYMNELLGETLVMLKSKAAVLQEAISKYQDAMIDIFMKEIMNSQEIPDESFLDDLTIE